MAKDKLVIVESPAKAKTISSFLPDAYVTASRGHIRDLPGFRLGVNIDTTKREFTPQYENKPDHKAIIKDLIANAKGRKVYLATDEDREGEAIAYHLATILGGKPEEYDRIAFHEITKSAILHAIQHPRKLDMDAVKAQEARRMLDRIVGFKVSQLLSNKVKSHLSAGRVQSAALKLVYDREMSIREFQPVTYFEFPIVIKTDVPATLLEYKDTKVEKQSIQDKALAEEILHAIEQDGNSYKVKEITSSRRKSSPKEPFRTSTLQQSASTELGFDTARTMTIAQKLYEGKEVNGTRHGLITYMRTDSLNLATEAVSAIRDQILSMYGKEYVHTQPRVYHTKAKGAQEAHEAIRVTDITLTPDRAKNYLEPEEFKLYQLIWERTMMCQMSDCLTDNQTVIATGSSTSIKISGRKLVFDGWTKLRSTKEDVILPPWQQGDLLQLQSVALEEKQTEPPARFNEASLVKTLEDLGVGRPSTYASIINLLKSRQYVKIDNKAMYLTETGEMLIKFLDVHFPEITDSGFTSTMETELDEIAVGKLSTNDVLAKFCLPLLAKIKDKYESVETQKVLDKTGEKCPQCGHDMVKRSSKFGMMEACSNYPACKYIKKGTTTKREVELVEGSKCPSCGSPVAVRYSKKGGSKFYGCSNYPKCKQYWKHFKDVPLTK